MKEPFHHLLDTIYPNNSLLILEAMIPYVDPSLKLPLALLIKIQEIQIIMQVLNNPSRMEACGLNRGNGDSEEMLSALCQAMGVDVMGQMKNMQTMMNMMNTMNAMNTMENMNAMNSMENMNTANAMNTMKNTNTTNSMENMNIMNKENFETPENSSAFSSDTRNDMIDAIRQILSEQEGDSHESQSTT